MSQGARICPHCKRRVDERRAKGLAYCLSCGQPLAGFAATSAPPSLRASATPPPSQYGTPPPSQYGGAPPSQYGGAPPSQYGGSPPGTYGTPPPGTMPAYPIQPQIQQQKGSGAVGLIIGVVLGIGGLFAIVVAIIIVAVGRSSSSSSSGASDDTPTSTVAIESPTTTASDDSKTAPTANAHHPRPSTSASSTTAQSGTLPFPTTRATERLEQAVLAAQKNCPRPEGPFGTTVVEVTFETDGRTGTISNKPIGGTPEGDCITAQFLEIHLGAFEGSRRTFAEAVTIQNSKGSTASTATASSRTNKPDAGH